MNSLAIILILLMEHQAISFDSRVSSNESTWWNRKGALHRDDLTRMRATTTLVMTQSNSYALFAD
jgi:hypothetical protein